MKQFLKISIAALGVAIVPAFAQPANSASNSCSGLPSQDTLKSALQTAVAAEGAGSGFNLEMWATIVDRDGIVCAVAFSGPDRGAQWPGSRVISAQKANTANAFSLDGLALSTANLYTAVQPGGSLFGLQESNPVDTGVAYKGPSKNYGQKNDPMVGEKIGGINVFGGGLALYNASRKVQGGLGVSGDSSCEDHTIAWRVRKILALDFVNGGVSGNASYPDNIVYGAGTWAQPLCPVPSTDPSTVPALAIQ
jgi:uncharacterized protein GlcG (DUF336 family)